MKKIAVFFIIILIFNSCSQNISFNETAFQGLKNNYLWESGAFEAKLTSTGGLVIKGNNLEDVLIINLNSTTKKEYVFGASNSIKAVYSITVGDVVNIFDTTITRIDQFEPSGFLKGDGKLIIKQYDGLTVSGVFEFNAVNADLESDQKYVNFKKGYFNNVPVTR